jgi:hypothetical protein
MVGLAEHEALGYFYHLKSAASKCKTAAKD